MQEFAYELRRLREQAGRPTYRELARRSGYSATALTVAARGEQLPSLAVTVAFVRACGGDPADWEQRWRATDAQVCALDSGTAGRSGAGKDGAGEEGAGAPYQGLALYDVGDADRFFGRERLVADLLGQVRHRRFATVVGPSGSGKSSLLRAGLIPAARPGLSAGRPTAATVVFSPGADPIAALAGALAGASSDPASRAEVLPVADGVTVTELAARVPGLPAEGEVLLVVDQFEEAFTLCADPGRRSRFIDLLLSARHPGSRVRVVLGLRGDFYSHCAAHRELAQAVSAASVLVSPMTPGELREVIVKPASREHVVVEPALVATVIADAGEGPGMLPLVSHALLETWRRRRGKALTVHAYQSAGGLQGGIAQTAESVYRELSGPQRRVARRILLRLITVDRQGRAARRPLHHGDLVEGGAAVLERLAQARLVTVADDLAQLAHEAVITSWPRLQRWLERDRDGLRIHIQLTEATVGWQELDRDPSTLYRGARLAAAREWAGRDGNEEALTATEQAFLAAAIKAQEAEQTAAARRNRRLRVLAAVMAVLLVIATSTGAVAVRQRQIAQQRQQQAQSRVLAGQALAAATTNSGEAGPLAVRAYQAAPTLEARSSLLSIAGASSHSTYLSKATGPPDWSTTVDLSPDGRLLASSGPDGITLWDTTRAVRLTTLGTRGTFALSFSPDGRWFAAAEPDRIVLWDTRRQKVKSLTSSRGDPMVAAFSLDGRYIAAAAMTLDDQDDQTERIEKVAVWDTASGREIYRDESAAYPFAAPGRWLRAGDRGWPLDLLPGYVSRDGRVRVDSVPGLDKNDLLVSTGRRTWKVPGDFTDGQLSRDGGILYAGDRHGKINLWDVARRSRIGVLTAQASAITSLTASHDGTLLASAGVDGAIAVHDRRRAPLLGHTAPIEALTYSPDGRTLISATGENSTALLWNPQDHRLRKALPGAARVAATAECDANFALHPNRTQIACPNDDTVDFHKLSPNAKAPDRSTLISTPSRKSKSAARQLAYSPDGNQLAVINLDGRIALWNTNTHKALTTLPGHLAPAQALAFSLDGRFLAIGGAKRTITLWDLREQTTWATLSGHTGTITSLAFQPDGTTLASAATDHTINLWPLNPTTATATLCNQTQPPHPTHC